MSSPRFSAASPAAPRAVAFIDGQNLFHSAREAFGYRYPNYDPGQLATEVCQLKGWNLTQTRFYTGVPSRNRDVKWHEFWKRKALRMNRAGVHVETRPLRYTRELLEDGTYAHIGREKGIDVRIAIDVMKLSNRKQFDVCLLFSQDQDLAELVPEIRDAARRQGRWIKLACAYPIGPSTRNRQGIRNTDWIRVERALYDRCLDV